MKKIVLSTVVATTLMFVSTGCGDSNKNTANVAKEHKVVAKNVSKEDRQKALRARIKSYAKYGFDINQTSQDSYILTVKEPRKSVELLLSMFNLNLSFEEEDKQELQELFKDNKFDVKIDWDKYVSNSKDSVEVDFIGKDDMNASDPIVKILKDKKIGAYLTYNGNDELKKIDFKDIKEIISQNNETAHIELLNAFIDIDKLPDDHNTNRVYTFNGGNLSIEFKDSFGSDSVLGYKDIVCKVDKTNSYLGKQECLIPTMFITTDKSKSNEMNVVVNKTAFNYDITSKNKKVKEDIVFSIDNITANKEINIKDIKVSGVIEDMDEEVLKAYMQLIENPSNSQKEDMAKLISLAGKLYGNGMKMQYDGSVASIDALLDSIKVNLKSYSVHGEGKLDNEINYHEKSTISNLTISDSTNKANSFVLDNFRFGYGIKNIFNFIPKTMDMLSVISTEENTTKIDNIIQQNATKLANETLNYGVGFEISTLGFDRVKFSDQKHKDSNYNVGKSDFDIDVALLKNKLKAEDVMANPMVLLGYLKADGKLVIPIKDLQELAKKPEFAMLGMLMMMAKIEGENAVFVIKFENGKLLVNGKPMM